MPPIVNGLEKVFVESVEFRFLDAASGEGQKAFNAYRLLGHPSYIILDPAGEVLWQNFGAQAPEILEGAINEAIATVNDSS